MKKRKEAIFLINSMEKKQQGHFSMLNSTTQTIHGVQNTKKLK